MTLDSTKANAASRTTVATNRPIVTGSDQPSDAARVKPYTSETRPSVERTTPGTSSGERLRPPAGSRITKYAPSAAMIANGMLTKNVQRQSRYSVRNPPSSRPTAPPPPAMAPKMPNAFARSLASVKVTASSESAAGASSAPKTPCAARELSSIASLAAAPPTAEAPAKPIRPMTKARLRPHRSPIRPPKSSSPPKARA